MYLNIIGKAKNIEYDIEEEDLDLEEELSQKEIEKAIKDAKAEVAKEHGKNMNFYLVLEDEDLDALGIEDPEDIDFSDFELQDLISDLAGDYISDKTDYCINGFDIDWNKCRVRKPTYCVGCSAYDKRNRILDSCVFSEHRTERAAIKKAETIKSVDQVFGDHPDRKKIKCVSIEVEKVLQVDDDETENIDTVWESSIESD